MKSRLTVLAILLCFLTGALNAQTTTASITGTVSDPSGAVVPNVKVTATNTATNLSYPAQTNEAGLFNILFLPVGPYNVTTEAEGFKKTVLGPFALEVNQIARVDSTFKWAKPPNRWRSGTSLRFCRRNRPRPATSHASRLSVLPLNGRNFASLTHAHPRRHFHQPERDEHLQAAFRVPVAVRR